MNGIIIGSPMLCGTCVPGDVHVAVATATIRDRSWTDLDWFDADVRATHQPHVAHVTQTAALCGAPAAPAADAPAAVALRASTRFPVPLHTTRT